MNNPLSDWLEIYFDEVSPYEFYREIAGDFEISEGNVKMTLLRIRNKLKQTLEKEGIVL